MIIGTAGHIDHGKTTLVRALTGVDTDRLPAEKARGISIELGYAYTPTLTGGTIGFIDVPGHERFVHTMLAGASGIDYALLVVAADDGVMPQTAEHVAILDLLGVGRGVVAITKADRVDATRLAAVVAEVDRLLAPTGLGGAELVPVDARDPGSSGITALRAILERAAAATVARRHDGLFRLCIDRAFTLAGHGTIVTGTAQAGEVQVGDDLTLLPAGQRLRVRGLHAQNRAATVGRAGERLALNLAGIEATSLRRGDWLADARAFTVTNRVDARLSLLPGAPGLTPFAPVHVHYAAVHATAHVVSLEAEWPAAGVPGWVQFVFDVPVAVPPGERYILRDAQARRTLGGGVLVDPMAPARRRRGAGRLALLEALDDAQASGDFARLLLVAPCGYSRAALVRAPGRAPPATVPVGTTVITAGQAEEEIYLLAQANWRSLHDRACEGLAAHHARHPEAPGPDAAALHRALAAPAPQPLWRALIGELVAAGRIVRAGNWLQLPGHGAALSARDEAEAAGLLDRLRAGAYDPPWARDLAATTGLEPGRVRELLARLGRAGRAYAIVPDLYFDAAVVALLAATVAELAASQGTIDAAVFRDRIGIGRKRAIQILEFFDRVGYTRRFAAGRKLRTSAGWTEAR